MNTRMEIKVSAFIPCYLNLDMLYNIERNTFGAKSPCLSSELK